MAQANTKRLWQAQNRHPGDRERLFEATAEALEGGRVLYPGSYVDVAASFVFANVTYVDSDPRAKRFFADRVGVQQIIEGGKRYWGGASFEFLAADYGSELPLADESFDLLVSLYAGFVSLACGRYLRPGGLLLANNSHGDASMASLDDQFELAGVINKRNGEYRLTANGLDAYLVPKGDRRVTRAQLERTQRGVGYSRSPAAYIFRRTTQSTR